MFWFWFWDAWFDRSVQWAVETAGLDDVDDLVRLHGASFARGWDGGEMSGLVRDRAVIADVLKREGRPRPTGFALSRVAGDEAEVLSIAVEDGRRRSGGGRALLTRHLGRLAGAGVRRVVLEVDEDNAAALALYARFGFVEVGRRKAYYARSDGKRGTARILALKLD